MYSWDDILIVGDSFAQDRSHPTDWPMALSKLLTGSNEVPLGFGKGGTSWWSVRKFIVKALQTQPPKVLIVCHTEAGRLPSDKDIGLNAGTVLGQEYDAKYNFWFSKEEWLAAQMYYVHLMSKEFHNWSRTHWFYELEHITTSIPIVIHLHCFEEFESVNNDKKIPSFIFKHGITSEEELFPLQRSALGVKINEYVGDLPGFRNHFSPENNVKIATALYNAVVNFDIAENGSSKKLNLLGN